MAMQRPPSGLCLYQCRFPVRDGQERHDSVCRRRGQRSGQGKQRALVGKPAGKLFKPSEGTKFATFAKALKSRRPRRALQADSGHRRRSQSRHVPAAGERRRTFPAPWRGPGTRAPSAEIDPRTGLASRDGFMAAAAEGRRPGCADPGECAGPAGTLRRASGRKGRCPDAAHRRHVCRAAAPVPRASFPTPASAPWLRPPAAR